jgi:hypothetical protein
MLVVDDGDAKVRWVMQEMTRKEEALFCFEGDGSRGWPTSIKPGVLQKWAIDVKLIVCTLFVPM